MPHDVKKLEKIANSLRSDVIDMLVEAGSGHPAGSLGTAEIFVSLYLAVMDITQDNFSSMSRDRFVLSNGHICPIWYATLSHCGFFPRKDLWKLRKIGSLLQGHPLYEVEEGGFGNLLGVENASGSLGQGLSIAIGMALGKKLDGIKGRVYCLTGDGELDEGQIWEAAMFGGNSDLNNITWIIDRNRIQSDGNTKDVLPLDDLREKLESFGWYVLEIDGHNVEEIINSCYTAKAVVQRPTAILANTTPGKGVDFMEYKFEWHGRPLSKEDGVKAHKSLEKNKNTT